MKNQPATITPDFVTIGKAINDTTTRTGLSYGSVCKSLLSHTKKRYLNEIVGTDVQKAIDFLQGLTPIAA